ncbi:UDP-glycosyltransferase 74F2-like [Vigna umbellata]|uniref:UDP-glycosyltransferase 74F2-like n=1 Tax=Vigna umbellata TaxID=87088 RepID=UPI001F5F936C|nr:UDP-glycosyltransferase 74F2-like [Vigna umbellata]
MEKEYETKRKRVHCLVLAYPHQGHINPMLQFSKRLQHDGVRVTLVTSHFYCKTIPKLPASITLEGISDGFDDGGIAEAESIKAYLDRFWKSGPQTLSELLERLISCGNLIDCLVYDSFLPWTLDIAKKHDLTCAVFLTQPLFVNCVYHHVQKGNLKVPLVNNNSISLPGLPLLQPFDLPSFIYSYGTYSASFELVVNQFSNIEKADWVLCNTFYELEKEVTEWLMKIWPKLKTIGPTIPSMFLDKRVKDDDEYDFSLFKSEECVKWMDEKPKGSIVYVSFGSFSTLSEVQMEEVAFGLQESGCNFLWVVRATEMGKIPKDFETVNSEKGLVVTWCSQLKVLEHKGVGCFVTHCGWNSTLEALSLGVPMIAMPQWTDQTTNAKLIEDVWKIGLRVSLDDKGIFRREGLKHALKKIMETEIGIEIKRKVIQWKNLAAKSIDEGGSSDMNIRDFMQSLVHS